MRAEGEKAVRSGLFSVERIVENRAAYPRKMAAYLMAETPLKLYGKSILSVIGNIVSNINNFSSVITAVIFCNPVTGGFPAFAVRVRYRADLFSAGTKGAEKTFNDKVRPA